MPDGIHIGSFIIHFYGIIIMLGVVAATFLIVYPVGRFLLEFLRMDASQVRQPDRHGRCSSRFNKPLLIDPFFFLGKIHLPDALRPTSYLKSNC